MLKDIVYTALGASIIVKEKIKEELKILEDKGKIQKVDAKELLKSLEKKGKIEDKKMKKQIKLMIKEVIDELGFATKKDLKKLKEDLENKK